MSSKGTIKRIVSDKGFGFVADESGQEYLFHQSACQSFDSLREGQAVTFESGQGPKVPARERPARPRRIGTISTEGANGALFSCLRSVPRPDAGGDRTPGSRGGESLGQLLPLTPREP